MSATGIQLALRRSAATLSFGMLALGCAWSGGDEDSGECDPTCLARCRSQCTNSVDADEYDQCREMCDCGCD